VETAELRRAADVLGDWDVIEEVQRVGARLRLVVGDHALTPADVERHLRAEGLEVRWVQEVEPSVEDLFVSFVDKQRKARLREQLRALDAEAPLTPALSPKGRGGRPQHLLRRRRRPVDLRLARRGGRQYPALRA
jgi:hypothetical protein